MRTLICLFEYQLIRNLINHEKTVEKYSKLKIEYSDGKKYAKVTSEDAPGKSVTLFLWSEAQVERLQEIGKKIEAENMEKSKIPYCFLEKKNNKKGSNASLFCQRSADFLAR